MPGSLPGQPRRWENAVDFVNGASTAWLLPVTLDLSLSAAGAGKGMGWYARHIGRSDAEGTILTSMQ